MTGRPASLVILLVLVVITSVGVVYAKHQGRKLFVELQALREARDSMDIEWGQLQLEQSTLTTQGQVAVSYTHLTLPTKVLVCRSRWSPYH